MRMKDFVKKAELTEEEGLRWLEIRFYYLCLSLSRLNNNVADIYEYVNTVSKLANCNHTILGSLIQEIFEIRFKPNKIEVIILACKAGMTTVELADILKTARITIYKTLDRQLKDDPQPLFHRSNKGQIANLKIFFEAVDKIHAKYGIEGV